MKYTLAGLVYLAALSGVQSHAVMQSPVPRGVRSRQIPILPS